VSDQCFFISPEQLKIEVCYVYPLNGHQGFSTKALEFAQSYQRNPPGLKHDTTIVCNGAPATQPSKDLFNGLPNLNFIDHDNSGWDIGAFQMAAKRSSAQLTVFCGAHTYFRKPGWLKRMQETFLEFGDTLYGSTGHQGDLRFNVHPHVRTTGFWCSPQFFAQYPFRVTSQGGGGERYAAEHGHDCISNWVRQQGKIPWIVGFDSVLPLDQCDSMPNGYHQGDQSNVLVGDRLTKVPLGCDQ